jgi:hypothetical protein
LTLPYEMFFVSNALLIIISMPLFCTNHIQLFSSNFVYEKGFESRMYIYIYITSEITYSFFKSNEKI